MVPTEAGERMEGQVHPLPPMRSFLFALVALLPLGASAQIIRSTPARPAQLPQSTVEMRYRYLPAFGTPTTTSGRSGNRTMQGNQSGWNDDGLLGGTDPIYAIEFGERDDKPCYIKTFAIGPGVTDDDPSNIVRTDELDLCGSRGPTSQSLRRVGPASAPFGNVRPALRGLGICSNDRSGDNYRIKGVRTRTGQVRETGDGSVTTGALASFERPNCREWEPLRTCPAGEVVVSLRVHYQLDSAGAVAEITGIAPRCAAIEHEPLPQGGDTCGPGHC